VEAWLKRMKSLRNWDSIFEAINGYGASLKGQPMVAV
jgi:glutathione S-transferase